MNSNFGTLLKQHLSHVKALPLLAGAVAITLSAITISTVSAQTAPSSNPTSGAQQLQRNQNRQTFNGDRQIQAQANPTGRPMRDNQRPPQGPPGMNNLNLTAEQQAQMERIHQSARQQMENVLTPEQRQQLQASQANGQGPRRGFESLNLTEQQRSQLDAIRESTRQQMDNVLTAEQRQQLEQNRPPQGGGRGGPMQGINLTEDQRQQMERLHQSERNQMASILTQDQIQQLQTALSNGQDPRRAFESLNLTDAQRQQMETLRQSIHEQVNSILTDEQRQQLEQHRPPRPDGMPAPQMQPPQ